MWTLKLKIVFLHLIVTLLWTGILGTPHEDETWATKRRKKVVIENITKSPNDARSYRGLILSNALKVMLISDPSTTKSAAAMVVGAGALNDPRDAPGLMDLLGYVLMMTSGKSTRFDDFRRFLRTRGGLIKTGSITGISQQTYSFEINSENFVPALNRFADIFLEPFSNDINQEVLQKALEYVHKDYLFRSESDVYRIAKVEIMLSRPKHPYERLFAGAGDIDSLYKNLAFEPMSANKTSWDPKLAKLKHQLQTFHKIWHSSNIMSLAVLGKESLNELEKLVTKSFENIENRNVKKIIFPFKYHPVTPDQLNHKIYIVPKGDIKALYLNFPIPASFLQQYKTGAADYISYLMMHGGPRSLASLLENEGLCTDLDMSYTVTAGIGFCTFFCKLSEDGVTRVDDIIKMISEYIYIVNDVGVEEGIFNEFKKLNEFKFFVYTKNEVSAMSYVEYMALDIQEYPMEDCLTRAWVVTEWNARFVKEFLCYFTIDNMNVTIVSKSFDEIVDQVEEHFGVRYKIERISKELLNEWTTMELSYDLQLPSPNEYLPEKAEMFPISSQPPEHPYVIHETSKSRFWFKQDNEFRQSTLHMRLEVISPRSRMDTFTWTLTNLLVCGVKSMLQERTYSARLVGYSWHLLASDHGLHIRLRGYTEKLPLLLEQIVSSVVYFERDLNENTFQSIKEKYIQSLTNSSTHDRATQAAWFRRVLMSDHDWISERVIAVTKLLRCSDMKKFLNKKLFARVFLLGIVHGNCIEQKAMDIITLVEGYFKSSRSLLPQETSKSRRVELANRSHLIYQVFREDLEDNLYCAYFQFTSEPYNPIRYKSNILSLILLRIISSSCRQYLTNEESEPTAASCVLWEDHGGRGLVITAQSKRGLLYLDKKVEKYLFSLPTILKDWSDNDLEVIKAEIKQDSLIVKDLDVLTTLYWHEIVNGHFIFNKRELMLKNLRNLHLADVTDFVMERLHKLAPKRRKLVIHAFPAGVDRRVTKILPSTATKIENLPIFKSTMFLSHH